MVSTIEEIRLGQLAIRFLLEGSASGGSVAMFEVDVPAGAKVPIPHSHDAYEETIYGLKGVITWTVEGQRTDVGPGEVLCIPRGAVHHFNNTSGADVTMLCVVTGVADAPRPSFRYGAAERLSNAFPRRAWERVLPLLT